jgi:transposase
MRTAYRCRAYPDAAQQAMLNRTFGCVRVVWNTILAARQERYATMRQGTSYGQASAALTAMKKDPQRAWLNGVHPARRAAAPGQDPRPAGVRVVVAGCGRGRAGP